MNGPIAQIVAITVYGNSILTENNINEYSLDNTTAKFCKEIKFVDWLKPTFYDKHFKGRKEYYSKDIASDFASWIDSLKADKMTKLYLHYTGSKNNQGNDRKLAGFIGGGGRWLIEAYNGQTSDFWEGKWEVTDREDEFNRIWTVTYARIARNLKPIKEGHSKLESVKGELLESLKDCRNFSSKHGMDGFQNCFENAVACLDEEKIDTSKIYHKDILTNFEVVTDSKRILLACQPAWVFGGMGSWNDISFIDEDQETYETISQRLFNALCSAITTATNNL